MLDCETPLKKFNLSSIKQLLLLGKINESFVLMLALPMAILIMH